MDKPSDMANWQLLINLNENVKKMEHMTDAEAHEWLYREYERLLKLECSKLN